MFEYHTQARFRFIVLVAMCLPLVVLIFGLTSSGLTKDWTVASAPGYHADYGRYMSAAKPADVTILRVKPNGAASNPCGASWDDACSLQFALTGAASGTEIWVAHGVYTPGLVVTATFQLKSGVALYGGFAGTEDTRDERDWEDNLSVLSGDINGDDPVDADGIVNVPSSIVPPNAYHVVTGGRLASPVDETAVLDGFVVTAGHANDTLTSEGMNGGGFYNYNGNPTINQVTFCGDYARGYGGGAYNYSNGSDLLVMTHVIFKNSLTNVTGGGFYNDANDLILEEVTFSGNQATSGAGFYLSGNGNVRVTNANFIGNLATSTLYYTWGAGFYMSQGSSGRLVMTNAKFSGNYSRWYGGGATIGSGGVITLTNVTFSGNYAGDQGGGLYNYISTTKIVNSILWGNAAGSSNPQLVGSGISVSYSDIQQASGVFPGTGNINDDPEFVAPISASLVPTTTGDYRLQSTSPAIDTGNNAAVRVPLDLDGNPRISGPAVDMGAYEYPQASLQISKQASSASVLAGRQLTYTLIVTNTGFVDLNILITDTLPLQVNPNGTVTWTGFITSSGGVWMQPLAVTVTEGYSGTLINQLDVISLEGPQGTYLLTTRAHTGYQTITFDPLPDKTIDDSPFMITATASSGLPVTFTTTSLACSINGNLVTLNAAGMCEITAHQAGNADYYPAPDVTRSFMVHKMDQTITFNPLPDLTYTPGDPFFVLVSTASSGLRVSFTTTSMACVVSGYIPQVGYTVTIVGAGSCVITAHQTGSDIYNPAPDVTQSFNIAKAHQTITFNPLPDLTYAPGDPFFVLVATASSGLRVSFTTTSTACVVSGYIPQVGYTVTIVGAGSCVITAHQIGSDNYTPAPDVTQGFNIAKAHQTITFETIPYGDPGLSWFNISATASSGNAVTFTVWKPDTHWPDACHIIFVTNTYRVINDAYGSGGVCTIDAKQDGDQNYYPAQPVRRSVVFKRGIWLTISLYTQPVDKTPYENIIKLFADAVYEESNGSQYLGTVDIYQNWQNSANANILWYGREWPNAFVSAYGRPGLGYLKFGDVAPFGPDYNFLANPQAAGYALAHELGHYMYGLYDEYAADYGTNVPFFPHKTDWPTYHSIMNNQWKTLTGDYGWLNFSVSKNTCSICWMTAQTRMYFKSGWSTLFLPPWLDPYANNGAIYGFPSRLFLPELTAVAPSGNQDAPLELPSTPTTTTRKYLYIRWHNPMSNAGLGLENGLPFSAAVGALEKGTVSYPEPVVLVANVRKGQLIAGAELNATLITPSGSTGSLFLKDDGIAPDIQANDGQYTGLMLYAQNGVYTVTTSFDNHAGTAWFTEIASMHSVGPTGETWVPTTLPVGEDFNVSASAQITITNWAADDHGDTPATATILSPDDFQVWGRVDRPEDLDIFKVTPEVSGTLVLRVTSLALGMRPHIRILGADGVTVVYDGDFTSLGNMYFFMRLEAQAGVPYYIEVSHQDGSAEGGLYAVSAGDPLDTPWEQADHWIYLPVIISK